MGAAADEACKTPPGPANAGMALSATRTVEAVATLHPSTNKGKLVSALLVGNPEIDAGLTPLRTMGGQPATAMPVLGEKMR